MGTVILLGVHVSCCTSGVYPGPRSHQSLGVLIDNVHDRRKSPHKAPIIWMSVSTETSQALGLLRVLYREWAHLVLGHGGRTSQLQGSTVEILSKALHVGGIDPERRSLPISSDMG